MQKLLCLSAWLLVLAGAARAAEIPVAAPADVGMSADKLAEVDAAVERLVKKQRLAGGIVMIVRRGQVAHLRAYGQMDLDSQTPMRTDAIVRIYSMTKAITSAAALMLHEEGKLELDVPVSKYLPEFKGLAVYHADGPLRPEREMTVRDLARHTSGLIYGGESPVGQLYEEADVLDREADLAAMVTKLSGIPLQFAPGTDWAYGVSIDVLGRVIEVASGQPLDEFFQQRIFDPLDMPDTGFFVPREKLERFATNYTSGGEGTLTARDLPAESDYLRKPKLLSGGGGLVSTARDYMRFLLMVANGGKLHGTRLLSPDSVRLMTANQLPADVGWIKFGDQVREGVGFGLGFSVRERMSDWDPQGRVGEYGWGGAASTHYWVSPRDDLIVVTLEQTMPYSFLLEFAVKGLIYDAITDGPSDQQSDATIRRELDLAYAQYGDRELHLDLFAPPPADAPRPAIVVIHGGGWRKGDKSRFHPWAAGLAERGYVTAAIEYRLAGEAKFPAAVHDCKAAVRWLRAHAGDYGIDSDRIGVIGGSAGGHLAGLLAASAGIEALKGEGGYADRSSRVQAAVVMAGPLDLTSGPVAKKSREQPDESNANQWIGKTIDEAPELYRLASATTHLSSETPPTLFLTGQHDNPLRNVAARRKLRELGVPTGVEVYHGGKHGCWNREPWLTPMLRDVDAFFADVFQVADDRFTTLLETEWGELRSSRARLALHVTKLPAEKTLEIPPFNNPIERAYVVSDDPEPQTLTVKPGVSSWTVALPAGPHETPFDVIVETAGRPRLPAIPTIASTAPGRPVVLRAHEAVTHGKLFRYEPQPHKNTVGYWANEKDWCAWHFHLDEPASFLVEILQGCGKGQGGSEVALSVGAQRIKFEVAETGHFQNFKRRRLGAVRLEAGLQTLELRALSKAAKAVMDVREVRLLPIQKKPGPVR